MGPGDADLKPRPPNWRTPKPKPAGNMLSQPNRPNIIPGLWYQCQSGLGGRCLIFSFSFSGGNAGAGAGEPPEASPRESRLAAQPGILPKRAPGSRFYYFDKPFPGI